MKANLKVVFSAVGLVALLASPAMAKQMRPAKLLVPSDARASVAGFKEGGPYTPSVSTVPHGWNGDFQNGSRG